MIVTFALLAFPGGAVAGAILANQLDGRSLTTTYWQQVLTLTGVAALPLVAFFALVPRQWAAKGTVQNPSTPFWSMVIPWVLLLAFAAAVAVILLCVYQIAVTPSTGAVPNEGILFLTATGAGATLGAVATGLVAAALDKVD